MTDPIEDRVRRAMFADDHDEAWEDGDDATKLIYTRNACTAVAAMNQWQDISTAKKDGTDILLYNSSSEIEIACGSGNWVKELTDATHWQPLPKPPHGE